MNIPRVVGLISLIAGIVMVVAGGITYGTVSSQLSAENIVVPDDAAFLAGKDVRGPFTAYAQADIINRHALDASEGNTYAELGSLAGAAKESGDQELADKYNAQRNTVMNASFLRASLFTSVLAFGVAAMVIGLGLMFGLIGWALMNIRPSARVGVHHDAPVV
ncbi:MAG: aromatic ring-opening dioxygenase LigA [Propionibacteriaceae bacterium]|nr:aromatic ring-opening dioxygenase LigA [Propionibacteriaceae bacterium]